MTKEEHPYEMVTNKRVQPARIQNEKSELSVKIPDDVIAIKSVNIEVAKFNSSFGIFVKHPFCSYKGDLCYGDKNGVYKLNYSYSN